MPTLSTLIDKFLTRSAMTGTDKQDIRGDIGAVGTALEITTALQGAVADVTKIGEEYLPESLAIDSFTLGNTSVDTLPVGSVGGTGNDGEMAWHNNSDEGGIKYQLQRNVINGFARATSAEIVAGIVHKEVGRFRLEPSEIVASLSGWYALTGEIMVFSDTDTSIATPPNIGIHVNSASSTTVTRGVYRPVTQVGGSGLNSSFNLFVPILFFDKSGTIADTYNLRADETKHPTHFFETVYAGTALSTITASTFSEQVTSTNGDALVTSAADIILSLRVPQDATFTGNVYIIAKNVALKPLA